MSIQKYKPEQIVTVLRQIEVQITNGETPPKPEQYKLLWQTSGPVTSRATIGR